MKTLPVLLFVSFILVLTFSSYIGIETNDVNQKFVVVLDAGHGGKDPGNMGNHYKEKDIALKVVLAVGKQLEKNPDIKVVYTRKTDVFVDLFERGRIANKAKANLFVSVHCNAHSSQAYGTETYVLGVHRNKTNFEVAKKENAVIFLEDDYKKKYGDFNPNSPESAISIILGQEEYLDQSIQLASYIQNNFTNQLKRKNRKVKQAGFIVLHQTVMPSVLIELGFLTHSREGAYLNSKKGQREMSESIAKAITKYKKSLDVSTDISVYEDKEDIGLKKESEIFKDVVFKVQIAASSRKLETKPYNFKGLSDISRGNEGQLYKYYYGNTSDYNEINTLVEKAKSKGYKTCFIVAFKNGVKVPLSDVLKNNG